MLESGDQDVQARADKALFKLLWEDSLYSPLLLEPEDEFSHLLLYNLLFEEIVHDVHCVDCGRDSTFKRAGGGDKFQAFARSGIEANWAKEIDPVTQYWFREIRISCQRDTSHVYRFFLRLRGKSLQKVGQFPSMEDVAGADIKRFRPVLSKELFSDLHRAGGLYSHGVGIGSFVYLRRIFETLIFDHHAAHVAEHGSIEGFETMRMLEKVSALTTSLPPTLVEYKNVYSILSKGVHELDEATCKRYFPAVKSMIIAVLEQDLQLKAKKEADARLKREMQQILGEIS